MSKKKKYLIELLVKLLTHHDDHEQYVGDVEELYHIRKNRNGVPKANIYLIGQILRSIPYFIITSLLWGAEMLKNYFKIMWRSLVRNKLSSAINIIGLAVGMTTSILILLWVLNEVSFDNFHTNGENIYRVTEHQYLPDGDYYPVAVTPWPLAEALQTDIPGIKDYARLRILRTKLIRYKDKEFYEDSFVAVDPGFMRMFSFPVVMGESSNVLVEPNTVLVTKETAKRYFGNEDPIGKVLTCDNKHEFKVIGVLENTPENSHLQFDFLVPFESTLRTYGWTDSWFTNNYYTYIQLTNNSKSSEIAENMYSYFDKINPQSGMKLIMQPLRDVHLKSNYAIDLYGSTHEKTIYISAFSIIAVFILLIACINFINLTTAHSEKRFSEIGLRKVIGASRRQLIHQFYFESAFMTLLSFLVALLSVFLMLPVFNDITGKKLSLSSLNNPEIILVVLGILLSTAMLSGIYPAIVQSSLKPIESLKGRTVNFTGKSSKSVFRRTLVVIQFSLSIILIIGAITISKQIDYMLSKDLGYKYDETIYFRKIADVREKYDAFKSELLRNPLIRNVTTCSDRPTYSVHSTGSFAWEGKNPEESFLIHQYSVDRDYIKMFNMNIIAGRDFSKEFPIDDSTQSFILNEAAVRKMELTDPIGKAFRLYDNNGYIVGIVEDFNYKSLQTDIEPLVMRIEPRRDKYIFVKYYEANKQEALKFIKETYDKFNAEYPLEYSFLDEEITKLYDSDNRTKELFDYFAIIAILISSLGLYSLASFSAQQKIKEIGVRKVLGASVTSIVGRFSFEFIILISISNIVAFPIAYLSAQRWIRDFAFRTEIDMGIFLMAGLISLIIALLSIGYQSIKSALANPVESIKYE